MVDDISNVTRSFHCPQNILISKMKYFRDISLEEVDISVHCDINIFAWIMDWVKQKVNSGSIIEIIIFKENFPESGIIGKKFGCWKCNPNLSICWIFKGYILNIKYFYFKILLKLDLRLKSCWRNVWCLFISTPTRPYQPLPPSALLETPSWDGEPPTPTSP